MDSIIDELKVAHENHIQKLTQLHSDSLKDLQLELQNSRHQLDLVTTERDELASEIEGMRTEVEMLRGSFELVQERLRRVLVDQNDLVKMVKLIDKLENKTSNRDTIRESNKVLNNIQNQNHNHMGTLKDVEAELKRKEQDLASLAALFTIKYFKKLEASDPVHLCRLLEIPFCPERSFALSTSLLTSISVHMASDANAMKAFSEHPVYAILLNEIVGLKQENNELCKSFLSTSNSKKSKKEIIAEISRLIDEKKENKSILKMLIEEYKETTITGGEINTIQAMFSTVLSKFGI